MDFNNIEELKETVNKLTQLLNDNNYKLEEKIKKLDSITLSLDVMEQNNKVLTLVEKNAELISKSIKTTKIVIYILGALLLISVMSNIFANMFGISKVADALNRIYMSEDVKRDMTLTDIGDSNAINFGNDSVIRYNDKEDKKKPKPKD